ncbi:MAG: prepilin-type N-terminal cleavage/methylation domain-containing protein [Gemmatimonadaceae bacterium]|nr:prepilin-type N-terminal cleavage/methylation domain-containing protein [Gemmatimonadaceae bacterium]
MIPRAGVTLLELILALAILGLMSAIVGLSAPRTLVMPASARGVAAVMRWRDSAIRSGHRVRGDVSTFPRLLEVTAFPDGRVLADSELRIDPLSGRASNAPR